jgi:hypothetical protein
LSEFPSDPSSLVKLVDEEGPEEEQLKLFWGSIENVWRGEEEW